MWLVGWGFAKGSEMETFKSLKEQEDKEFKGCFEDLNPHKDSVWQILSHNTNGPRKKEARISAHRTQERKWESEFIGFIVFWCDWVLKNRLPRGGRLWWLGSKEHAMIPFIVICEDQMNMDINIRAYRNTWWYYQRSKGKSYSHLGSRSLGRKEQSDLSGMV